LPLGSSGKSLLDIGKEQLDALGRSGDPPEPSPCVAPFRGLFVDNMSSELEKKLARQRQVYTFEESGGEAAQARNRKGSKSRRRKKSGGADLNAVEQEPAAPVNRVSIFDGGDDDDDDSSDTEDDLFGGGDSVSAQATARTASTASLFDDSDDDDDNEEVASATFASPDRTTEQRSPSPQVATTSTLEDANTPLPEDEFTDDEDLPDVAFMQREKTLSFTLDLPTPAAVTNRNDEADLDAAFDVPVVAKTKSNWLDDDSSPTPSRPVIPQRRRSTKSKNNKSSDGADTVMAELRELCLAADEDMNVRVATAAVGRQFSHH